MSVRPAPDENEMRMRVTEFVKGLVNAGANVTEESAVSLAMAALHTQFDSPEMRTQLQTTAVSVVNELVAGTGCGLSPQTDKPPVDDAVADAGMDGVIVAPETAAHVDDANPEESRETEQVDVGDGDEAAVTTETAMPAVDGVNEQIVEAVTAAQIFKDTRGRLDTLVSGMETLMNEHRSLADHVKAGKRDDVTRTHDTMTTLLDTLFETNKAVRDLHNEHAAIVREVAANTKAVFMESVAKSVFKRHNRHLLA